MPAPKPIGLPGNAFSERVDPVTGVLTKSPGNDTLKFSVREATKGAKPRIQPVTLDSESSEEEENGEEEDEEEEEEEAQSDEQVSQTAGIQSQEKHLPRVIKIQEIYKAGEPLSCFDDDMSGVTANGKRVVSVNEIRALRPPGEVQRTLKTPGFVMFLTLCVGQYGSAERGRYRRRNVELREHAENRFVSNIFKKQTGLYNVNSLEARTADANVHLNRLNAKNGDSVMKDLKECRLDDETLARLFIDRGTADIDSPDKNEQLMLFAKLAVEFARMDSGFKMTLRKQSVERYKTIACSKDLRVTVLQTASAWIAYLLKFWVIPRRDFFECLETVVKHQHPSQRAADVIRIAMLICGSDLDSRKYYEAATFYAFLDRNTNQGGYLQFLIADLMQLRSVHWNPEALKHTTLEPVGTKPPPQQKGGDGSDLVDVCEAMKADFEEWVDSDGEHNTPNFGVTFDEIGQLTFSLFPKMSKVAVDFAVWAALLWKQMNPSQFDLYRVIKREFQMYSVEVIAIDNGSMWLIVFQFLGALQAEALIPFELIMRYLEREIPLNCPRPDMAVILESLSLVAYANADEMQTIMANYGKGCDPNIRAIMIMLTESNNRSQSSDTELGSCLFLRDLLFTVFADVTPESDVIDLITPHKNEIKTVKANHPEISTHVFLRTLNQCSLSPQQHDSLLDWICKL